MLAMALLVHGGLLGGTGFLAGSGTGELAHLLHLCLFREQEEERRNKFLFGRCMYELKYEYGVKEDWEMEDSYESDASYHSSDDY